VLGFFFRKEHAPLAGGEGSFILDLIRVHEGGWYGLDLRNHVWRFVVTAVIVGALLL